MRMLRTLLSTLLALIAIPLLTMAACNFAIDAAIFNRATYDSVLDDDVIFEQLASGLLPLILNAPLENIELNENNTNAVRVQDIAIALQNKPDVVTDITTNLFPVESLQGTIRQLVDTLFAITNGDIDTIDEQIDLTIIRERLRGETASEVARVIILQSPACSVSQRDDLRLFFEGGDGSLPICRPTDETAQVRSIETLETWLRNIGDEWIAGDQVTISELLNISRDDARIMAIVTDLLFNQALVLFFLCPFGILSLIIIINVRKFDGFSRWIGGVSIVSGVFLLLLILGLQLFAFGSISEILESTSTASEIFLARFFSALVRSAINASSTSLLVQSAGFIGFGFFLLGLAWYLGRDRSDEQGDVVLITEDGQVISTATQRRIATIDSDDS